MSIASYAIIFIIFLFLSLTIIRKISVSYALLLANIFVFFITIFHPNSLKELAFNSSYIKSYKIYTIFTAMFLHLNFYHILLNMIGLVFIGLPFENEIGGKKFAIIYFASGFFASVAFSIFEKGYAVGASGAIFGLLGAFAFLYPMKRVVIPFLFPFIILLPIPVLYVAIFYASIETIFAFYSSDMIAHTAHLGGFIAGIFFASLLRKERTVIKKEEFDLEKLEEFIINDRQREIFEKIKQADEKEVREAWLSYLMQQIKCPRCNGKLEIKNGIKCKKCGYKK